VPPASTSTDTLAHPLDTRGEASSTSADSMSAAGDGSTTSTKKAMRRVSLPRFGDACPFVAFAGVFEKPCVQRENRLPYA
jgi:hypothetical protein